MHGENISIDGIDAVVLLWYGTMTNHWRRQAFYVTTFRYKYTKRRDS